jgi:hypothetical protein
MVRVFALVAGADYRLARERGRNDGKRGAPIRGWKAI